MTPFIIVSASAGSGKTFRLAQHYLQIILSEAHNHKRFKQILAITFTNKAAAEMKERILMSLKSISEGDQQHPFFSYLCKEINIDPETLKQRAKGVLNAILHDFNGLSVLTIDKFFLRLIRTFSFDLQLPFQGRPSVDQDEILQKAMDKLLDFLGEKTEVTQIITRYLQYQMGNEDSLNIENAIQKMGSSLFQETHKNALEQLQDLSVSDFIEIEKNLRSKLKTLTLNLQQEGKNLHDILIENNITPGLLSYDYLLKCTQALSAGDANYSLTPNFIKTAEETRWLTKKNTKFIVGNNLQPLLDEVYEKAKKLLENEATQIRFIKLVLNHLSATALLNELKTLVEEQKEEDNLILINDFNEIIYKHLREESVEFIYERLGDRYQFLFIDEFQDTSIMQWGNLLPLAENAIASGGQIQIIGDPKQAIYRFRAGDSKQMLDLISNEDTSNLIEIDGKIQEKYARSLEPLEYNYRSSKDIVAFNNSFFNFMKTHFAHKKEFVAAYADVNQIVVKNHPGFVSITMLEKKSDEVALNKELTLQYIQQALQLGYAPSEIGVLVRKKAQGQQLAAYLSAIQLDDSTLLPFKIVSSESFVMDAHTYVAFVLDVFAHFLSPQNKEIWVKIVSFLHEEKKLASNYEGLHDVLLEITQCKNNLDFHRWIQTQFAEFEFNKWQNLSTTELYLALGSCFDLPIYDNSFLVSFFDVLRNFSQDFDASLSSFVRWWHSEGRGALSLSAQEMPDAIQILTLHKAKGLQWPVVILPFMNWEISKSMENKGWVALDESFGLPTSYVDLKLKEELSESYNEASAQWYEQVWMDNMNLLYVALTRPEDRLHIISGHKSRSREMGEAWLVPFLENQGKNIQIEETSTYTWGAEIQKREMLFNKSETKSTAKYSTKAWRDILSIAPHYQELNTNDEARNRGIRLHKILSDITHLEALELQIKNDKLAEDDRMILQKLKQQITESTDLMLAFSKEARVLNERSIWTQNQEYRPDRLSMLPNGKVWIIDYKTGEASARDTLQLNEYQQILASAGYAVQGATLLYI